LSRLFGNIPTLRVLIFFAIAQNILEFYGCPQTAHLALPQPHKPPLQAKPKEPFLANALLKTVT
jgi:hypothetical protein